jgi:hypothetical protein
MRHFLKYLPEGQREIVSRKYGELKAPAGPKGLGKGVRIKVRQVGTSSRPDDVPDSGSRVAAPARRVERLEKTGPASASRDAGELFRSLAADELSLQDTGTFTKPAARHFNPYDHN